MLGRGRENGYESAWLGSSVCLHSQQEAKAMRVPSGDQEEIAQKPGLLILGKQKGAGGKSPAP